MPSTATQQQPTPEQVAAYERLERARAVYRETVAAPYVAPRTLAEGAARQLAHDAASRELDAAVIAWRAVSDPEAA